MTLDPQRDFYQAAYSQFAPVRSRWAWLERWFPSVSRIDLAVTLLPGGHRLLDVGCGSGDLLYKASNKYAEIYGVDVADVCVERARAKLADLCNLSDILQLNVDANGLPWPDGYFDAVTCIAVLQFLFDVDNAILEMHRVLREGGILVIEVNNLAYLKNRLTLLVGRQPRTTTLPRGWDGNTLHYFTLGPFIRLLQCKGFAVDQICSAGRFNRLRSLWPSLLAENVMVASHKITLWNRHDE